MSKPLGAPPGAPIPGAFLGSSCGMASSDGGSCDRRKGSHSTKGEMDCRQWWNLGDNHGWGNDPKIAWVVIFRELTDIFSDN